MCMFECMYALCFFVLFFEVVMSEQIRETLQQSRRWLLGKICALQDGNTGCNGNGRKNKINQQVDKLRFKVFGTVCFVFIASV